MLRDVLLAKSLRDRRRGLVGWSLGIVTLVTVQMAVYPTVRASESGWESATESFPEVFREIFRITDYTSEAGYLSTELMSFMIPFIFMGIGASWGSRLTTDDEENGTADIVLGLPISRRDFVVTRLAAAVTALLIGTVCFVASLIIGGRILDMSIAIDKFVHSGLVAAEVGLVSLSIAALVGSLTGHRGVALGGAMSFGVVAFVFYSLAPLVDFFDTIDPINPWKWSIGSDPLNTSIRASEVVPSIGASLALIVAASWFFGRRDIVG